jgi:ubiquinone/menaquinone biosynthesis C-methylase UbiE
MLRRARRSAAEAGAGNVHFRRADAEHLPLPDGSIDVALVNGIFNLNPARDMIFRELARVVRPGGAVFSAELILREPPTGEAASLADWFS